MSAMLDASDSAADDERGIPNSVLGKAFSILSAFDDDSDSLRLVDLSQRSGVPKPSVYRLAQELVSLGLLERAGSRYRLGFSVFALSQRVGAASLLRKAGRPVLVDLVAMTRATAHLAVLEGSFTYYLEKLGGTRSVHVLSHVGGRLPLTCTASGKLLLALSPTSEDLLAVASCDPLHSLTANSPTDFAALCREVDHIRAYRLATEREEALIGFKSFAAPVCDAGGGVIAALSLTVPTNFVDETGLVRTLRAASACISKQHTRLAMGRSRTSATMHGLVTKA